MTYSKNSRTYSIRLRYDDRSGTYRLRDGNGDERLSTTLVLALAEIIDVDPLEMEPLYDAIDPDLLDDFADRADRSATSELSFVAYDHRVTVHADGHVIIRPR